MKTKAKTMKKVEKKWTKEKSRPVSERKFVKKWLGATVFAAEPALINGHGDGVFYLVLAVDVIRGKIAVLETDTVKWRDASEFIKLKSGKSKHWKRPPQYIAN